MDNETVITHLQIIHIWAKFARERDLQFFTAKHLEDIAQWSDDAIVLLKEQEPIEPVDDGHGSLICGNQGFGCGCVGAYNPRTKAVDKFCNFCPECGRGVKWE